MTHSRSIRQNVEEETIFHANILKFFIYFIDSKFKSLKEFLN